MSYPEECPGENFQGKLSGGNLFKEKNVPQSEKCIFWLHQKGHLSKIKDTLVIWWMAWGLPGEQLSFSTAPQTPLAYM